MTQSQEENNNCKYHSAHDSYNITALNYLTSQRQVLQRSKIPAARVKGMSQLSYRVLLALRINKSHKKLGPKTCITRSMHNIGKRGSPKITITNLILYALVIVTPQPLALFRKKEVIQPLLIKEDNLYCSLGIISINQ